MGKNHIKAIAKQIEQITIKNYSAMGTIGLLPLVVLLPESGK